MNLPMVATFGTTMVLLLSASKIIMSLALLSSFEAVAHGTKLNFEDSSAEVFLQTCCLESPSISQGKPYHGFIVGDDVFY